MDSILIPGTKFDIIGHWFRQTIKVIEETVTKGIIHYKEDDGYESYGLVDKSTNKCIMSSTDLESLKSFINS